MKKILSAAMASAMVLSMGASAFAAVEYNSTSSDSTNWPTNFRFEDPLFVIDKDGKLVSDSLTDLNDTQNYGFYPGDEIYMPLSADNQKVYGVVNNAPSAPAVSASSVTIKAVYNDANSTETFGSISIDPNNANKMVVDPFVYYNKDVKVAYYYNTTNPFDDMAKDPDQYAGWRTQEIKKVAIYLNNATENDTADLLVTSDVAATTQDVTLVLCEDAGTSQKFWAEAASTDIADAYALTAELAAINPNFATDLTDAQIGKNVGDSHKFTITTAEATTKTTLKNGVTIRATLPALAAVSGSDGKFEVVVDENNGQIFEDVVKDGPYTGNIDKDWSINLVEETHSAGRVTDIVEKAEFYRASPSDIAKYNKDGNKVFNEKAVYVKVTLKDFFDSVDSADLKYYTYVAANNGKTNSTTNKVWVAGKYQNNTVKYVDFKWTNNANEPAVWQVKKGENGTAVFDFKDQAFFTVKMYSEEKMYLNLDTTYQKAVAGEWDADFDSFFKFKGTNANFAREGELILASDDANLNVYQINADGDLVPVDAAYVEDYQLVNTNEKINGYVFNTRELGNYVLSADELEATEEETPNEEETLPEPEVETPEANETNPTPSKNNPSTGANDMVGVSVALAVVSVAAAGALALKK